MCHKEIIDDIERMAKTPHLYRAIESQCKLLSVRKTKIPYGDSFLYSWKYKAINGKWKGKIIKI